MRKLTVIAVAVFASAIALAALSSFSDAESSVSNSSDAYQSADTSDPYSAVHYTKVTFTGLLLSDTVTVTPVMNDDGSTGIYQKEGTGNDTFLFEKCRENIDSFSYLVTATDKDDRMIAYANLILDSMDPSELASPIKLILANRFTVSGYAGLDEDSTVTAIGAAVGKDGNPADYSVCAVKGAYSMVLPAISGDHTLVSEVKITDGNHCYNYRGTRTISDVHADMGYTCNFSVTSSSVTYNGSVRGDLTITRMSGPDLYFTLDITNGLSDETRYLLSAGSAWTELHLYNDYGTETTSVLVDGNTSRTLYGTGKIDVNKAGFGTQDLSVLIKDENGRASCTAVFGSIEDNLSRWVKYGSSSSSVECGVDSYGTSWYMYAVKITNNDNYTKTYSVHNLNSSDCDIKDKWMLSYVCGRTITEDGSGLTVMGYQTAMLYVKIVAKDSVSDTFPSLTFDVRPGTDGDSLSVGESASGWTDCPIGTKTINRDAGPVRAIWDTSEKRSPSDNTATILIIAGCAAACIIEFLIVIFLVSRKR